MTSSSQSPQAAAPMVDPAWKRIDPARVKADVLAAGLKLDAETSILADKSDDHTKNVVDPSVRGRADQVLCRFEKPQ